MQLVDRRTYRGKHPGKRGGYVNDRTIVSINTPLALIRYLVLANTVWLGQMLYYGRRI